MKVKNLTNEMKKIICTLLAAAMVFTDTGMTTLAKQSLIEEESTQAEETQQEFLNEKSEEMDSDETDAENVAVEEISDIGNASNDLTVKKEIGETITEAATEEVFSETEKETECSENELKLSAADFSDSDIAHGENDGGFTWVIDAKGNLLAVGRGNGINASYPWTSYREDIITAKLSVSGISANLFNGCSNLISVDLSGLDTSNTTNMSSMFASCSKLENLDLSNFNTSNVTNMDSMFYRCNSLRNLNLGDSFKTEKVTNMHRMFEGCNSLTSLDVSSFDTSEVTNMRQMFSDCNSLTSLDVTNFDTSNISDTNMVSMFSNCSSLTSLDVSNFDTSKVTNMMDMFSGCSSLTNLDVSNFDTSKVINMCQMFCECSSLLNLNVSNFNTSNVTSMDNMFRGCGSLTSLDVSEFDTSNVTDMGSMFSGCGSLENLDVNNFDTSNVTDMGIMFQNCSGLISLNVSNFVTDNVIDMRNMFTGCSKLTSLDLSNFNTRNVTNMASMFSGCNKLMNLDVNSFNTGKTTDMKYMFNDCSELIDLNLTSFDTLNVTDMHGMFWSCSKLASLDVTNFDTSNVTDMCAMFCRCSSLTSLDLSNFNTDNVTDMGSMFNNCGNLTSLDLSNFNTLNVTSMIYIFNYCTNLTSINTPYGLTLSVSLPDGTWYDSAGNTYTELPTGKDYSVLLAKDKKPDAVARITVKKTKTTYQCGDTISVNDLTVTYYDTDGTQRQLAVDEYTTNAATIKTSEVGEQTLTITYNGLAANVILTISAREESSEPEESGSTEGSKTEESSSIENSKTDESSNTTESSSTEENSSTENSSTEESSEPAESSPDETDASPVEWEYPETLKVERTTLTADSVEVKAKKRIYDGTPYTPDVKVTVKDSKGKKTVLTEGTDYSVRYSKNVDAGEGTVTVKGNGAYKGTVTKTFTIAQKPIKKLKTVAGGMIVGTNVDSTLDKMIYVYDGTKKLTYNEDYTLEVTKGDTTKKGKLQVAVSAKDGSNYTGTGKDAAKATVTVYETTGKNFKGIINPADVAFETAGDVSQTYTGKALKPTFKVTVDGTELGKKDFSVKYTNNKEAGTAYATITGKGGYVGSVVKTFEITPVAESGGFTLKKEIKAPTYNGKLQKPKVTVTSGGKTLKAGKDYRISYSNNLHATPENAINADKAKITITGIGNYKGMNGIFYFEIKSLEIKKASVKGTQNNLDITCAKHPLIKGYDYEITEITPDGKKVKVTLTGKGDFTGTVTKKVNAQ